MAITRNVLTFNGRPVTKEDWKTIDPAGLSPKAKAAYDTYKAAASKAAELRKAFDDVMQADVQKIGLAADKRVVMGFNFGKLSMALADAAKPAAPKNAVNLAALVGFHTK